MLLLLFAFSCDNCFSKCFECTSCVLLFCSVFLLHVLFNEGQKALSVAIIVL